MGDRIFFFSKLYDVIFRRLLVMFDDVISEADLDIPMFDGESFLSAPIPSTKSIRHVTTFALEIKTTASDGMLIWIGEVSGIVHNKFP